MVERTFTSCGGKLKASVVKENAFELEGEEGRCFQADQKGGEINYPVVHWKGQSSSGFEFRLEKRPRSTCRLKHLCPASISSIESCYRTSKIPQNDEIGQIDYKNQAR